MSIYHRLTFITALLTLTSFWSADAATGSNKKTNKDDCPICLDEMNESSKLRRLTCGHVFHDECIDTFYQDFTPSPCCTRREKCSYPTCNDYLFTAVDSREARRFPGCAHAFHKRHDAVRTAKRCLCATLPSVRVVVRFVVKDQTIKTYGSNVLLDNFTKASQLNAEAKIARAEQFQFLKHVSDGALINIMEVVVGDRAELLDPAELLVDRLKTAGPNAYVRITMTQTGGTIDVIFILNEMKRARPSGPNGDQYNELTRHKEMYVCKDFPYIGGDQLAAQLGYDCLVSKKLDPRRIYWHGRHQPQFATADTIKPDRVPFTKWIPYEQMQSYKTVYYYAEDDVLSAELKIQFVEGGDRPPAICRLNILANDTQSTVWRDCAKYASFFDGHTVRAELIGLERFESVEQTKFVRDAKFDVRGSVYELVKEIPRPQLVLAVRIVEYIKVKAIVSVKPLKGAPTKQPVAIQPTTTVRQLFQLAGGRKSSRLPLKITVHSTGSPQTVKLADTGVILTYLKAVKIIDGGVNTLKSIELEECAVEENKKERTITVSGRTVSYTPNANSQPKPPSASKPPSAPTVTSVPTLRLRSFSKNDGPALTSPPKPSRRTSSSQRGSSASPQYGNPIGRRPSTPSK